MIRICISLSIHQLLHLEDHHCGMSLCRSVYSMVHRSLKYLHHQLHNRHCSSCLLSMGICHPPICPSQIKLHVRLLLPILCLEVPYQRLCRILQLRARHPRIHYQPHLVGHCVLIFQPNLRSLIQHLQMHLDHELTKDHLIDYQDHSLGLLDHIMVQSIIFQVLQSRFGLP